MLFILKRFGSAGLKAVLKQTMGQCLSLRATKTSHFDYQLANFHFYLRQKAGTNKTNKVNISSRPSNMAKQSTHLDTSPMPA